MSTTSHRRSLSRSPIGASSASSSDRQQLSQKVQQQRTYRRPFSESLNHPDDDDNNNNPGNDHHEEHGGDDDANVAVGVLVRGGADIDDADENDDNLAAFSQWGRFYDNHCTYLPAMAGWFFFSACLSAYNKLVFGQGHMAFPCPLLLTTMHFGYQWKFAYLLCRRHPEYFGADRINRMSWGEYLTVALPCGLVTSGDVGLSNLSLVTISITFYTMVKASTPIFVLAWAYVFGIEKITCNLLIVVAIIAAGEFLTVMGEVEFEMRGFFMCLSASVMSGARWTLVQLKLQTMDPPLKTTVATMRMLAPSMFFSMLLLSIVFERPWNKFEKMDGQEALHILGLGSLGASFAIAMILCEFYLIMYSSAVILMIGGVLKEMVTIILGVTLFHDQLNRVNLAGCFVVLAGIVFYKVTFHLDKHKSPSGGGAILPDRQYSAVDGSEDDLDGHGNVDEPAARHDILTPKIQPLTNSSQSKQGVMTEQHVELRSRAGLLSHSAPTSPVGAPKGLLV